MPNFREKASPELIAELKEILSSKKHLVKMVARKKLLTPSSVYAYVSTRDKERLYSKESVLNLIEVARQCLLEYNDNEYKKVKPPKSTVSNRGRKLDLQKELSDLLEKNKREGLKTFLAEQTGLSKFYVSKIVNKHVLTSERNYLRLIDVLKKI